MNDSTHVGREWRPLHEIAAEIISDYADRGKNVPAPAMVYVRPMTFLNSMSDMYYFDDGETIMAYALSNLSHWRGETARRVKAEMREMLGLK